MNTIPTTTDPPLTRILISAAIIVGSFVAGLAAVWMFGEARYRDGWDGHKAAVEVRDVMGELKR